MKNCHIINCSPRPIFNSNFGIFTSYGYKIGNKNGHLFNSKWVAFLLSERYGIMLECSSAQCSTLIYADISYKYIILTLGGLGKHSRVSQNVVHSSS